MKISDVPEHIALAALSQAAKARGITYGALVAATTELERQQIILVHYKKKRKS